MYFTLLCVCTCYREHDSLSWSWCGHCYTDQDHQRHLVSTCTCTCIYTLFIVVHVSSGLRNQRIMKTTTEGMHKHMYIVHLCLVHHVHHLFLFFRHAIADSMYTFLLEINKEKVHVHSTVYLLYMYMHLQCTCTLSHNCALSSCPVSVHFIIASHYSTSHVRGDNISFPPSPHAYRVS